MNDFGAWRVQQVMRVTGTAVTVQEPGYDADSYRGFSASGAVGPDRGMDSPVPPVVHKPPTGTAGHLALQGSATRWYTLGPEDRTT